MDRAALFFPRAEPSGEGCSRDNFELPGVPKSGQIFIFLLRFHHFPPTAPLGKFGVHLKARLDRTLKQIFRTSTQEPPYRNSRDSVLQLKNHRTGTQEIPYFN